MTQNPNEWIATENQEQRSLVRWIRMQPQIRDYLVKLNNEGRRNTAQGWNLKMMGMCKGASDLFLAYPIHPYHGLWIELKRSKRYCASERSHPTWIDQSAFIERMRGIGYDAHICFGFEEGIKVIKAYFGTQAQNLLQDHE